MTKSEKRFIQQCAELLEILDATGKWTRHSFLLRMMKCPASRFASLIQTLLERRQIDRRHHDDGEQLYRLRIRNDDTGHSYG